MDAQVTALTNAHRRLDQARAGQTRAIMFAVGVTVLNVLVLIGATRDEGRSPRRSESMPLVQDVRQISVTMPDAASPTGYSSSFFPVARTNSERGNAGEPQRGEWTVVVWYGGDRPVDWQYQTFHGIPTVTRDPAHVTTGLAALDK